ncbi:MAG: hypothetical protein AAF821_13515 [Cyanobacteria bacterium P01_D01_bin.156]
MAIIINDVDVIAPSPSREDVRHAAPANVPPAGPTPRDIYWVTRKLMARQLRSQAR